MGRNVTPTEALVGGNQEALLSIHARLEGGAVFTPDMMARTLGQSAVCLNFDLLTM